LTESQFHAFCSIGWTIKYTINRLICLNCHRKIVKINIFYLQVSFQITVVSCYNGNRFMTKFRDVSWLNWTINLTCLRLNNFLEITRWDTPKRYCITWCVMDILKVFLVLALYFEHRFHVRIYNVSRWNRGRWCAIVKDIKN